MLRCRGSYPPTFPPVRHGTPGAASLCLPGVTRKTVRIDDLRAMIAEVDERAATLGRGCNRDKAAS